MATENSPSTESAPLPESTNVHEAAALMDALEERDDDANGETAGADSEAAAVGEADAGSDTGVEGEDAEGDAEGEGEAEAEAGESEDPALSEAPEFWSAEDKAAWATVPPALRPLLHKIDKQRVQFEQEKAREAAEVRKQATEEVQKVAGVVDEAAKWWQANGPQFFKSFGDKWAQVNWVELSEKDPAECQRLTILRDQEAALLRQAHERGQRDIAEANKRAMAQINELKRTEHEKLAAKIPEFFGTTEKATATYKELSEFLFSKGIPAERIEQIHEAPIIEMALNAMRFEKAQKQASTVVTNRDTKTGKFTAETPKRVQPGPGAKASGDRNAEQARRVGERFIKSGGRDIRDAAELIRLRGL
jgi:hypothetical protein